MFGTFAIITDNDIIIETWESSTKHPDRRAKFTDYVTNKANLGHELDLNNFVGFFTDYISNSTIPFIQIPLVKQVFEKLAVLYYDTVQPDKDLDSLEYTQWAIAHYNILPIRTR